MHRLTLDEAQQRLPELLDEAADGATVVIERGDGSAFQIVPAGEARQERTFGRDKGKIWMSDDFDAPLPEFEPYT